MIIIQNSGVNVLPKISFCQYFWSNNFWKDNDKNLYFYYIFFPKYSNFAIILKDEYTINNDYFFDLTNRNSDSLIVNTKFYSRQMENKVLFLKWNLKSYKYKGNSGIKVKI